MSENLERFQYLLNKALDNELSDLEKIEFENLLSSSQEFKDEWNSLKKIKEISSSMKFKNPPEELWDKYWLRIYSRLERGVAWILISIGVTIILVYGGFKLVESIIEDVTLSWLIKGAIIAIIVGFAILIVSVIRERFFIRKSDKYKEIVR